jgi:MinD superfamily P-loop ATPase
MKEVVILSGKGGTGKTSIVASFAALARCKVLADCDVDAADLHLLLQPTARRDEEFWSGEAAFVDEERCTRCGLCQDVCRFGAIKDYSVDQVSCEGCGLCSRVCPADAIAMQPCMAGYWFISDTRHGTLVHAKLGIAQENSGKLVTLVRVNARRVVEEEGLNCIVSDGPPGIGCPAVASLTGADLALLVTEPTLSGIHDLERVVGLCRYFHIPAMVCINKCDLNGDNSSRIEEYCDNERIEVAARVPFDNVVTEALVRGLPVVEYSSGKVTQEIEGLWQRTRAKLGVE